MAYHNNMHLSRNKMVEEVNQRATLGKWSEVQLLCRPYNVKQNRMFHTNQRQLDQELNGREQRQQKMPDPEATTKF